MRDARIARNYADTLLSLARKADDVAGFGRLVDDLADSISRDATLRRFLESPRVGAPEKRAVLTKAFEGRVPATFLRFLHALVTNRRQTMIPAIATEYRTLVDEAEGRIDARVTVARPSTPEEESAMGARLSAALGKRVVTHFTTDPAILGGVIVKVGDMVMDGSVRRRLATLRSRMIAGAAS